MAEIEDGDREVTGESTGGIFDGQSGDTPQSTEVTGTVNADSAGGVFNTQDVSDTGAEIVVGTVEAETPGAVFERSADLDGTMARGTTGETPDDSRGGVFENSDRGGFVDSLSPGAGPDINRGPAGPGIEEGDVVVTFDDTTRNLTVSVQDISDDAIIPGLDDPEVTLDFNDTTRVLTATLGTESDTTTIPGGDTDDPTVDVEYNDTTDVLTVTVGENSDTATIVAGGGLEFDSELEEAVFLVNHALDQPNEVRSGPFLSSSNITYGDGSTGTLTVNRLANRLTNNRRYRGTSIDALGRAALGVTREQALYRRFTRPTGVFTNRRFWEFGNALDSANLMQSTSGLLTDDTGLATQSTSGLLSTIPGFEQSTSGLIMETA